MNSSQTKWLAGLAVALLAFILFTELRRPTGPPRSPAGEPLVPRLRPATVTRIEFVRSNVTVRAEFDAGQWRLTAPLNYPANSLLLKTLLEVCAHRRPQLVIPSAQAGSPADFGLSPPQATLVFHQGGAPLELRIGSRAPVGSQLYVQVGGTGHIAVTDAALGEFLPRIADDWRDRSLLALGNVKFDRLRVRTGARDLTLQRDATNRLWRITLPTPPKRADTPRIEELLTALRGWPVLQFISDDPRVDLETYGLQTPESELAFGLGTNDTLVVQFGKSPTNQPGLVFARSLATTNIMLVPAGLLGQLRAPVWDFAEHRLLDALPPEGFDTIEVRGREPFTLRRQTRPGTSPVWVVEDAFKTVTDPHLMTNFLLNLETLEARELEKEVVTDFAPYGLAAGARSVTLLQSTTNATGGLANRLVARLEFGSATNSPVDRLFARRHDESSVYVVPRGDVDNLAWSLFQVQDRAIWNFTSNQVAAVTVSFDGQTRRLTRAADGHWSEGGQPADDVRNLALEETLFRLGRLRAEQWTHLGADLLPIYGISETRHRLGIELAGPPARTNTIALGFMPRGRNPWAAVTDTRTGQPLIFEFPRALYLDYIAPYLGPSN